MSRARRKGRRNRQIGTRVIRPAPEPCDCPACSGDDLEPAALVADLMSAGADLAQLDNALDAEMIGAGLVGIVAAAELPPELPRRFVADLEVRGDRSALAVLSAIGSVASGGDDMAALAAAAADRLAATGVPAPRWAAELAEPVRVGDCVRLNDHAHASTVLIAPFRRGAGGHAIVVATDEHDCGAATDILVVDAEDLPELMADIMADSPAVGVETVDPAELRWYVENALGAREVHDEEDPRADDADDGGPPFAVQATLVRARMATLPEPRRPAGAHPHHVDGYPADDPHTGLIEDLAAIVAAAQAKAPAKATARMPAKRKKSAGPAPVYQLKVGLRGARPPIWRRLLVPADVGLARLHRIIQVAFDWDDSHLHVFTTPYGEFGQADRELGHRSEGPVTLEQVAQRAGDSIRYTYDFGDDWEHEILVEKVLDPDPNQRYPRCTGGRRLAPPDDCGGIWGYRELVAVLTDPDHPDHAERLEWYGLDDAGRFDPAAFDPDAVNEALAALR